MINAYADSVVTPCEIQCNDIYLLEKALTDIRNNRNADIRDNGTAMRFLIPYAAIQHNKETLIDGTERMRHRPVKPLVEALRSIGADISYKETDGYPPVIVRGRKIEGGHAKISGQISSQFISALMLAAPYMESGLTIEITGGEPKSAPYIGMTISLMSSAGAEISVTSPGLIRIEPGEYRPFLTISAEADWSAASVFYELCAVTRYPIKLHGLENPEHSLQGDSRIAEIFNRLGVETIIEEESITLRPIGLPSVSLIELDMSGEPDLVPCIAVTCAMLNIPFKLVGVKNLRIKECDRLEAIVAEMRKIGYDVKADENCLYSSAIKSHISTPPTIDTYSDHRIAMAFAPIAALIPGITIKDTGTVSKSFPFFWEEIAKAGIISNEI